VKSKSKQKTENGLTFADGSSDQELLNPGQPSYVDHFWADKADQTGFDILLEKHLNGKNAIKEMAEFFRERAALEEQYAKGLLKLSKSTFGDTEEGTLGKAWQVLKAESFHRSKSHSQFAAQLLKEVEKPMLEFKEIQKKERKEVRFYKMFIPCCVAMQWCLCSAPAADGEVEETGPGIRRQHRKGKDST
jgi:hypothetical protein